MALWWCAGCSAAYAVGLLACPNCGSTDWSEEDAMPKITNHGGPTNDAAPKRYEWVGEHGPELIRLPDGNVVEAAPEEEPSPGTSSETSSSKPSSFAKPSSSEGPSRARTTANRSSKARTGTSSARGTAGSPEAATSPTADGGEA